MPCRQSPIFQSTPSMVATRPLRRAFSNRAFQSTTPHGGDYSSFHTGLANLVSIHAPALGATRYPIALICLKRVSIHPPHGGRRDIDGALKHYSGFYPAPAWGATSGVPRCKIALVQSTPPMGGDEYPTSRIAKLYVSIHAPHGGDPGPTGHFRLFFRYSIHGPRMEGRPPILYPKSLIYCFNPRPRMGGDLTVLRTRAKADCFIPRPRNGGRRVSGASGPSECFNPRPPHGGDWSVAKLHFYLQVSIPHPPGGRHSGAITYIPN